MRRACDGAPDSRNNRGLEIRSRHQQPCDLGKSLNLSELPDETLQLERNSNLQGVPGGLNLGVYATVPKHSSWHLLGTQLALETI